VAGAIGGVTAHARSRNGGTSANDPTQNGFDILGDIGDDEA
jgi:hypothetical protein